MAGELLGLVLLPADSYQRWKAAVIGREQPLLPHLPLHALTCAWRPFPVHQPTGEQPARLGGPGGPGHRAAVAAAQPAVPLPVGTAETAPGEPAVHQEILCR